MKRGEQLSRRNFVLAGLGGVSFGAAAIAGWRVLQSARWLDVRWRAVDDAERVGDHMRTTGGAEYRLNQTGWWLWQRCDGRRNGEELVVALSRHASISRSRAARDVHGFLAAAAREGLVAPA